MAGILLQRVDDGGKTDGGADCVKIGKPVSHNEAFVSCINQFHKCLGNHAGTHFALFLHRLGDASEEGITVGVLDRRLVAAASQCHFKGLIRPEFALAEIGAAVSHANGKGHRVTALDHDLASVVQYGESGGNDLLQILFLHKNKASVARVDTADTAVSANPFCQQRFKCGDDSHAFVFTHLEQFLFVVEYDENDRRSAHIKQVLGALQLCNIIEIQYILLGIFYFKLPYRHRIYLFFLFYLKLIA